MFLNGKGELQTYHKSVLVPGVEKMPFVKHLGFLKKFIIDLGGSAGSYGTQPERTNFVADDGTKIAPVICYESVFGEYLSEYVKKGASLIFIITNDGWWKNTPGYKQHMSFSRLRAIETRRSIARAANTGISCFINQKGEVFQKTQWWAEAVIKGQINTNNKLTFYVNYGDFIGRLSAFLSVLILLLLVVTRLKR